MKKAYEKEVNRLKETVDTLTEENENLKGENKKLTSQLKYAND